MRRVDDIARQVRSKNAGPFRITIDCFCADETAYRQLCAALTGDRVAEALRRPSDDVRRFELNDIRVLKFSLPRPVVQGAVGDRDQHGAQLALVIAALSV